MVVAYGRTGSTVIQRLINQVDGCLVRGENYGVTRHLFRAHKAIVDTKGQSGLRRLSSENPWYGADRVEPGVLLESMRRSMLDEILSVGPGLDVAGFKEVRHTPAHFESYDEFVSYLVFMDKLLPGIKFIFNVRDPSATVKSGWWTTTPGALETVTEARTWLMAASDDIDRRLGSGRTLLMDHDTWSVDTRQLRSVLDFMDLELDPLTFSRVVGATLNHAQATSSQAGRRGQRSAASSTPHVQAENAGLMPSTDPPSEL
jgi:Sulfotransferase family